MPENGGFPLEFSWLVDDLPIKVVIIQKSKDEMKEQEGERSVANISKWPLSLTKIGWKSSVTDLTIMNRLCVSHHSMASANLNKSEDLVTNTIAASKYIPRRPRLVKFSYSEKATIFCEISTVDLTVTT